MVVWFGVIVVYFDVDAGKIPGHVIPKWAASKAQVNPVLSILLFKRKGVMIQNEAIASNDANPRSAERLDLRQVSHANEMRTSHPNASINPVTTPSASLPSSLAACP